MGQQSTLWISFATLQELENCTCRICGCQDAVFLNLLKPEHQSFLNLVQNTLAIKITSDDVLPKNICHSCTATLHEFQSLLNISKIVQKELADKLEQLNTDKVINDCVDTPCENGSGILYTSRDKCNPMKNSDREEALSNKIPSVCVPKIPDCPKVDNQVSKYSMSPKYCNTGAELRTESSKIIVSKSVLDPPDISTPKMSVQAVKQNPVASPQSKTDDSSKKWLIHTIPGNDTTLFVCRECNAILVHADAKEKHVCGSSKVNDGSLPTSDEFKALRIKRKKRTISKAIVSSDDSESGSSSKMEKDRKRIVTDFSD